LYGLFFLLKRGKKGIPQTLTRFPGMPDAAWENGLTSMEKELLALKARHEG
jgi:hypothetical protein